MRRVNLLPDHYQRSQRRRQRWINAGAALIPALALAVMLFALAIQQMDRLDDQIAELQQDMHSYAHQPERFERLDAQRHAHHKQIGLYRALLHAGESAGFLAMLAGHMSDETALASLTIHSQLDPQQGLDELSPMRLTLDGYGRSNYQVAVLVNALERAGAFENVRLELARETELHAQNVHAFTITCRTPGRKPVFFTRLRHAENHDET